MTETDLLRRLAERAGIVLAYEDDWGNLQKLSDENLKALLCAMGFDVSSEDTLRSAVAHLDNMAWKRPLPPVLVGSAEHNELEVPIVVPAGRFGSIEWSVTTEDSAGLRGKTALSHTHAKEARTIEGRSLERRLLRLPVSLPAGYHDLRVELRDDDAADAGQTRLIIAPGQCYLPAEIRRGNRLWGLSLQLYGLRSERNWGIGDFTDLAAVVRTMAGLGASVIGLNPLHAPFLSAPGRASPYSASSRLFLNALYLDVDAVPDVQESPAIQERRNGAEFKSRLSALRAAPLVDYSRVAQAKLEILEMAFGSFRERHLGNAANPLSARGRAFRQFQAERGDALYKHACFDALAERFGDNGNGGFYSWPAEFRHPETQAVRAFAEANADRIDFYSYLQWQAELQLAGVGKVARKLGMPIGLYLDLAVGAAPDGAEIWSGGDHYVREAAIGAPPDQWIPTGQDWSLPPLNPLGLGEAEFSPFVSVLRANMRGAGALRIDHVFGLMRQYWVPSQSSPPNGGYVRYPFDELLALVSLESRRNRCLVVGEDLGTVPEGLFERLQAASVLSYCVLYFEKDEEGQFRRPRDYPLLSVAVAGTHDLPTLRGFWSSHDLAIRSELGLFPSDMLKAAAYRQREHDRKALIKALRREGLFHGRVPEQMNERLAEAIHLYLARSAAAIQLVQVEDVLGELEQPNIPGTVDEHPNWRRKLSADLSDWLSWPRTRELAEQLNKERASLHRTDRAAKGTRR